MSHKKIYITGSKGFIGTHLVNSLRNSYYNVIKLTKNEIPPDETESILINLAATTTLTSEFNAALFHNNIWYAQQLFNSFSGRIIYASSTSAAELTNPYSYTKRYMEHLGKNHSNAVGLRLFNVYGPGNNKGIIKKAIECERSGHVLQLNGAENVRDFIYIDDVVKVFVQMINDSFTGLIDVGTGVGTKVLDAVKLAGDNNVFINIGRPAPGDMLVSIANPGIPGCISLKEGLKKMKQCEY